jgi:tetratricopeptide (TPR) repeat protein
METFLHKYLFAKLVRNISLYSTIYAHKIMKSKKYSIDEAFEIASFSDKMWLFFQKHFRSLLVGLVVVVSLAGLIVLAKVYFSFATGRMQKAYSLLETQEDKKNFVKKHTGHELAGLVALSLGDDCLLNGDYSAAVSNYEQASKILKSTVLLPRVQVSHAIALYKLDKFDSAEKLLRSVIYNTAFERAFRGYAAYILMEILRDSNKEESLRIFLDEIEKLDLSPALSGMLRESA